TLDARARGEAVESEGDGALATLMTDLPTTELTLVEAAEVAHARAAGGLLVGFDPGTWAEAAETWQRAGDPWAAATAQLHEAAAAIRVGAAARAADALRAAYRTARSLGAERLVASIEALSRSARLSVEESTIPDLGPDAATRFGLTPRETEVLALVAAG